MIDASGGVLDQDYEMFEQQTPHLLMEHEFWEDSAGVGQYRGGLGIKTAFKIRGKGVNVVTFGDGDFEPAFGLFGGKDAQLNRIDLIYPDGKRYTTTSKDLVENVPEGTVWYQEAGGGGGYGNPFKRPAEKVAEEVKNGIISVEGAKRDYGVSVNPKTFAVDEKATSSLRKSKGKSKAKGKKSR
jgi:N-methylhydantoinase B